MTKRILAIAAIAALPITAAMAQTTTTPNTTTPGATTPPAATTTAPAGSSTTTTTTSASSTINYVNQQSADQMLASRLIGMTVRGSADENIGEINDLLVEKDGKINAVVIGVGGFLGIGEKDVAVPYSNVQFTADGQNANNMRAMVASTKDALKNAPEFKKAENRTAAGTSTTTGATGAGGSTMPRTTTTPQ